MKNFTALFLTFTNFLSLLFGTAGSESYIKLTGFKEAFSAFTNRKEIKESKFVGTPSDYVWTGEEFTESDMTVLTKKQNEDFVILNISDTHFADYDERAIYAAEGTATIKRLVSSVQPDLITLSGDLVCSDSTVYAIKRLTDLMESFGIPWAPVFGNHDDEGNCDANYLADIMLTSPHCLLKKGDKEMGVGNYIIGIAEEAADGSSNLIEALIMMDSHHSQPNEKQKQWYEWAAKGIAGLSSGKAEVSLIMHIPIPEYQYAYDLAWDEAASTWRNGYAAYGEKHEDICCEKDGNGAPVQRGFFETIKACKNTKYIFCGHEHMNNFSIEYEGVRLTYTLKLGYGSGFQFGFNGGTVIKVGSSGINEITHKTYSALIPVDIVKILI